MSKRNANTSVASDVVRLSLGRWVVAQRNNTWRNPMAFTVSMEMVIVCVDEACVNRAGINIEVYDVITIYRLEFLVLKMMQLSWGLPSKCLRGSGRRSRDGRGRVPETSSCIHLQVQIHGKPSLSNNPFTSTTQNIRIRKFTLSPCIIR